MSYQKDRDEFIAVIVEECEEHGPAAAAFRNNVPPENRGQINEGGPVGLARLILRNATTIQRCEELACSSESADRDRIACPGGEESCLCRDYGSYDGEAGKHGRIPRINLQIERARRRICTACEPWGIKPHFSGDPRGACVKLILPSGRWNSFGGAEEGFCVPTR